MAINHGRAFKIRNVDPNAKGPAKNRVCPCCRMHIEGQPLPLNCKLECLYKVGNNPLGSGYGLYFYFVKHCIILLIILLAVNGIYNLFTNLSQEDCDPQNQDSQESFCVIGYATISSLANKRDSDTLLTIQLFLNLISMIIILPYFHFIRYKMRKSVIEAGRRTITAADYTLKLTRIPMNVSDIEIKTWFESFSTAQFPIECLKVIRTNDIKDVLKIESKKQRMVRKYSRHKGQMQQSFLQHELTKLNGQLNDKIQSKGATFTPAVYVIFSRASMPDHLRKILKPRGVMSFIKMLNPFSKQLVCMNGHKINIKSAPEPGDVQWQNLGCTSKNKRRSRVITTISTLLILFLGFLLILLIYWIQRKIQADFKEHTYLIKVLSGIASLMTCLINILLVVVIKKLTEYEKYGTKTGYSTSVARKQSIALLINTAFIGFLVEIILSGLSISNNMVSDLHTLNIYNKGGLIENMFFVLILNNLYVPVLEYFDPEYIYKIIMQKKALAQGPNAVMTQQASHRLFEGPKPDMPDKYSFHIRTMLLTSFYAPVMPLAIIIAIIGLLLTYMMDKYFTTEKNGTASSS